MAVTTFKIVGKRALMMHNPQGMDRIDSSTASKKKVPTPEEEAELAAYRNDDGVLYLKSEMFIGALRRGCSGYKVGKSSAKIVVAAAVVAIDERIPLYHPKTKKPIKDYKVDIRRAVLPKSGAAVMRARPRIEEWACDLKLDIDEELAKAEVIGRFLKQGGALAGVGDQRPGAPKTPGPFGTFDVTLVG